MRYLLPTFGAIPQCRTNPMSSIISIISILAILCSMCVNQACARPDPQFHVLYIAKRSGNIRRTMIIENALKKAQKQGKLIYQIIFHSGDLSDLEKQIAELDPESRFDLIIGNKEVISHIPEEIRPPVGTDIESFFDKDKPTLFIDDFGLDGNPFSVSCEFDWDPTDAGSKKGWDGWDAWSSDSDWESWLAFFDELEGRPTGGGPKAFGIDDAIYSVLVSIAITAAVEDIKEKYAYFESACELWEDLAKSPPMIIMTEGETEEEEGPVVEPLEEEEEESAGNTAATVSRSQQSGIGDESSYYDVIVYINEKAEEEEWDWVIKVIRSGVEMPEESSTDEAWQAWLAQQGREWQLEKWQNFEHKDDTGEERQMWLIEKTMDMEDSSDALVKFMFRQGQPIDPVPNKAKQKVGFVAGKFDPSTKELQLVFGNQ